MATESLRNANGQALAPQAKLAGDVKRRFGVLSFPELKLASREVAKLLSSRLAKDPDKARAEMEAFDKEHPEELIYY